MHANWDGYEEAKSSRIVSCHRLLNTLGKHDTIYRDLAARDTVERINSNLLCHPDRLTYKGSFGFAPGVHKGTGINVSVAPGYSFVGGEVKNPNSGPLKEYPHGH